MKIIFHRNDIVVFKGFFNSSIQDGDSPSFTMTLFLVAEFLLVKVLVKGKDRRVSKLVNLNREFK
jgi:hypothetical protein